MAVTPGEKTTGTAWYADAENWAKKNGLLEGTGKEYHHDDFCPRGDVVYYLYRELS